MIGIWDIVDVLYDIGLCLLPLGIDTILQACLLVDEVASAEVSTDADASLVVFVGCEAISDTHTK